MLSNIPDYFGVPSNSVVLVTVHGLGDTHLVAGLAYHVKAKFPDNPLVLVVKEAHRDLALMFDGINQVIGLDQTKVNNLRRINPPGVTGPMSGLVFFTHPADALIRGDYCVAHQPMSDAAMYAMILGLPPTSEVALPHRDACAYHDAKLFLGSYDKMVMLVPYANSWPNIHVDFWDELEETLQNAGYKVLINDEDEYPLRTVFSTLEYVGWVIGANCGFMQVAVCGQFNFKKTILHQALYPENPDGLKHPLPITSNAQYANVRKIDGNKYDIEEFRVDDESTWGSLINKIIHGRNALGGPVITTPLTVVDIETSPGDVIDRLTILKIKQERLPEKAWMLQREISLLMDIRDRLVAKYPGIVIHEAMLRELNQIAWDNNQILIDEVVDGYGKSDWELTYDADPNPLQNIDKAEKVIKAFAAAHWSNRHRITTKNDIDAECNAGMREEKSYTT